MYKIHSIILELKRLYAEMHAAAHGLDGSLSSSFVLACPRRADILFVGLNPSYAGSGDEFVFTPGVSPSLFRNYFRTYAELASDAGYADKWSYTDLFHFRGNGHQLTQKMASGHNTAAFLRSELRLSFTLIEDIQPKMIVVCNASVRRYFGVVAQLRSLSAEEPNLGYLLDFDPGNGIYLIRDIHPMYAVNEEGSRLKGVPVLFSSSHGFRDKSERERLVWFVRRMAEHGSIHPELIVSGKNKEDCERN
jgi:hypothetical protein